MGWGTIQTVLFSRSPDASEEYPLDLTAIYKRGSASNADPRYIKGVALIRFQVLDNDAKDRATEPVVESGS